MPRKINLTAEDILNKEFSVQYKGYVPEEVDSFLDEVLEDFKNILDIENYYETQNKALQKSNAILRNKVDELETELELEKSRKSEVRNTNLGSTSNLDLIKKIASLESELFQTKKELEEVKKN